MSKPTSGDPGTAATLDEHLPAAGRAAHTATEPHGAAALDARPPTRIAHYVLLGRLGAGGMGMVFTAFDEQLERKVALKVLRPLPGAASEQRDRAQQRLLREARSLARLSHPNVVAVYEVGTLPGGDVFIAMEFVRGPTLRAWQQDAQPSWRDIVRMYAQAGAGLAAAHRADIVHRDFKPDNVLVGEDGRPRVLDFGLARLQSHPDVASHSPAPASDDAAGAPAPEPLTAAGAVMGTPGYMAPEQATPGEHDARVDQFSFCVALYEALYGERPYPDHAFWPRPASASTSASTSDTTRDAARRPRPERIHAAWLYAVLERGLALAPDHRFPSMDELLAELTRDRRRTRLLALAALVAVGVTSTVATATLLGATPAEPCPLPRQALAGVWDQAQKQRIHEAFQATGQPFAGQTWRAVEHALDRHTGAWMSAHQDACQATHVRYTQSGHLLDLRMECLAARKRELDAVTQVMTHSPARAVEHADDLLASLGDVAVCANTRALRLAAQPPRDADLATRVADARADLATAGALFAAGDFDAADTRIQAAGDALDYPPLEAERLHLRGRLDLERGHIDDAVQALRRAAHMAVAERHDELVADAWLTLALEAGPRTERPARAHDWARHADAALRRLGHPDDPRRLMLDEARGRILAAEGRFEQAADTFARAIQSARARWGSDHPRVVKLLHNRANALAMLGQAREARALYQQALDLGLALWGPDHPHVADTRFALGLLLIERLGDLDRGADQLARARRIYAAAHGEQALDVGHVELALTQLAMYRGQYPSGLPHAERALAIYDQHLGSEHPRRGEALMAAGALRFLAGDVAASLADYRAALAILEPALGADHVHVGLVRSNIGESLLALGRRDEAIAELTRALDIMRAGWGPDHINLALPLKGLGLAELSAGRPHSALAPLERALTLRTAQPGDPQELAEIQWALARTLAALGRRPQQRRDLATRALDTYRALGPQWHQRARDIARWLDRTP